MSAVRDLRDKLINLIGDLLGTYTFVDSTTAPAIWVGAKVPEGTTVSGLEVVIAPDPEIDPMPMQVDRVVRRGWQVIIKQHDDNDVVTLHEATERLVAHWPEMGRPVVIPATYETLAQARLRIPQHVRR